MIMKGHFALLFLFMWAMPAHSQIASSRDKITQLSSAGDYRIVRNYSSDTTAYKISEYYATGELALESISSDKTIPHYEGPYTTYYRNGNKQLQTQYVNDVPMGRLSEWYENGKKKLEGEYLPKDIPDWDVNNMRILQYWDENGTQKVVDGNGDYRYTDFDNVVSEGRITDGLKDGVWTGKNLRRRFSYSETYNRGKFISGTSIDSNSVQHPYTKLMIKPGPKKGLQHFYGFISKKFHFSKPVKPGQIILSFVVEKDGSLSDIRILKSIDAKSDNEAVRVLTKYPDWQPGMMHGRFVRVRYSLPIKIKSNDS